ncbi:MAG TPA: HlyD family efflux transporter periplasmic adaptor subunit [Blastocatellia bacterium]|nr:HlyD family efflux transporter periplasmic adaptor subunit [Blastocatellia bacterium]
MDREIDPSFQRKKIVKRGAVSVLSVSLLSVAFVWGSAWIRPSVSKARIRTAKVDQGAIEATITASGTVVPEFEQVISSPLDTRVVKILKKPGDVLTKGEPILQLDVAAAVLALEKANQQIELQKNQQEKAKIDLANTLDTLQSQWEIKNLEYKSFKAATSRDNTLVKQGLMSEEQLRQAQIDEEKTALELKQLDAAKKNAQESTKTQIEGLGLQMKSLEQDKIEAQRQLDLATTKSDRNGVLTWVVNDEGGTVHKGDVLARIADLNSFRIDATVSDVHANQIAPGMPTTIKINEDYLEGSVFSVNPTIKDGVLSLVVALKDKSNALLHSNLRVDVLVGTERKDRVLRIKKGPSIAGDGVHDVFVVRGDTAIKTQIKTGIASFDYYEVVSGLLEGDEVIISDMSDYLYLKEIKLKS